ncbi:MAG: hypothetical protein ABSH21_05925 [Verrucomicrobiia bacterium]|jgi:hypothetical protein
MIFPVVAALRAVAKALSSRRSRSCFGGGGWRVGDCEARIVRFLKEFGVSQKRRRKVRNILDTTLYRVAPANQIDSQSQQV